MANVLQEQSGLDDDQKKVVKQILHVGHEMKATPRELVTALITGLQESGLKNLPIGAETSGGWRQERAIYYPDPTNVHDSAQRFFKELRERSDPSMSVGEAAQAAQRSAYPEAYQPHISEAREILKEFNHSAGGGKKTGGGKLGKDKQAEAKQSAVGGTSSHLVVGKAKLDKSSQQYKAAALSFIQNQGQPGALSEFMTQKAALTVPTTKVVEGKTTAKAEPGAEKVKGKQVEQKPEASQDPGKFAGHPNAAAKADPGLTKFEGETVAKWIKPYLVYARKHGWKGSITSGYRSEAEQRAIYDSGVRPAAVPGTSNHEGDEFPRGAIDVSGAEELSKILENKPGGSALKWAGSVDPVHFSHPHDGSY